MFLPISYVKPRGHYQSFPPKTSSKKHGHDHLLRVSTIKKNFDRKLGIELHPIFYSSFGEHWRESTNPIRLDTICLPKQKHILITNIRKAEHTRRSWQDEQTFLKKDINCWFVHPKTVSKLVWVCFQFLDKYIVWTSCSSS